MNGFGELQAEEGIDAEEGNEEGLDGMDNQDEEKSGRIGDAIEYQHGLDCEMPRAGAIGGGDKNGNAADNEGDGGTG